jgi:hypothetical protein
MLLQPGQGMGLLNAYAPQPQMYNPQMNHYNSLLGRIGGLTFSQTNKPLGDVGNYWMGNTLMSGSTGSPVYNLPSGAGQTYGTTQSYMDELGRMPISSNEIVSPYIYYRPQTDLAALQEAIEKQKEDKKQEEAQAAVTNATGGGGGNGGYQQGNSQQDNLAGDFSDRVGIGGYGNSDTGMSGGTTADNNTGTPGGGADAATGWS